MTAADKPATDRAVDIATAATTMIALTLALLALIAIGIAWIAGKVL